MSARLACSVVEEARDVLTSDAGIGEIALMADVRITVMWREFVIRSLDSRG